MQFLRGLVARPLRAFGMIWLVQAAVLGLFAVIELFRIAPDFPDIHLIPIRSLIVIFWATGFAVHGLWAVWRWLADLSHPMQNADSLTKTTGEERGKTVYLRKEMFRMGAFPSYTDLGMLGGLVERTFPKFRQLPPLYKVLGITTLRAAIFILLTALLLLFGVSYLTVVARTKHIDPSFASRWAVYLTLWILAGYWTYVRVTFRRNWFNTAVKLPGARSYTITLLSWLAGIVLLLFISANGHNLYSPGFPDWGAIVIFGSLLFTAAVASLIFLRGAVIKDNARRDMAEGNIRCNAHPQDVILGFRSAFRAENHGVYWLVGDQAPIFQENSNVAAGQFAATVQSEFSLSLDRIGASSLLKWAGLLIAAAGQVLIVGAFFELMTAPGVTFADLFTGSADAADLRSLLVSVGFVMLFGSLLRNLAVVPLCESIWASQIVQVALDGTYQGLRPMNAIGQQPARDVPAAVPGFCAGDLALFPSNAAMTVNADYQIAVLTVESTGFADPAQGIAGADYRYITAYLEPSGTAARIEDTARSYVIAS